MLVLVPRTTTPPPATGRPAPRWVTAAAIAVPLCVLPSALWRLTVVADAWTQGEGPCHTIASPGEGAYVAGLSVVSMAAACLTLGLVRPWGEVFPRWLPFVGGTPVPVRPVTIVSIAGATIIALLIAYATVVSITAPDWTVEPMPPGCSKPGWEVGVYYLPLIAWPPLLYLVTYQYYRRRTARDAATPGMPDREAPTFQEREEERRWMTPRS
jgi:hypothetical protein